MGALDDAIREHLELKRRQGASEEELKRKEDEAFGRGSPRFAAASQTAEPEIAAPEAIPEPAPPSEPPLATPEPVELTEERSLAETEIEPDEVLPDEIEPDEIEPDEVLPDETLEPERENGALADDVLEETPDFLDREAPDQDRLWFERKPPKDFDFDS